MSSQLLGQVPRRHLRRLLAGPAGLCLLALASVAAGAFVLPSLVNTPTTPAPEPVPASADSTLTPAPAPTDAPKALAPLPGLPGLIDREASRKLAEARLPASPLATDEEFLRRAFLDITGKVPSYERTVRFLNDTDPAKRGKLIDELLTSPDYGRHFARLWADALIKRDFDNNRGLNAEPFVAWLAGRFNDNAGWDQIVRELITAEGHEQKTPPVFFILANMDNRQPSPAKLTGAVGNLFLGIQLQCAECHQHPFCAKLGVEDFWGVAAFFGHTVASRPAGKANRTRPATITEVESTPAARLKKGPMATPVVRAGLVINVPDPNDPRKVIRTARGKFLDDAPLPVGKAPYRPHLASWVARPDNPFFAAAAVNRLWAHFFARGIAHPVEEMGGPNQPTHPELLAALAKAFVARYDLKELIRVICTSHTYQRTSRPLSGNAADDRLLSHMPVKVMDARQLIDALAVVTGKPYRLPREAPARGGVRDSGDPLVRALDTRAYDDDPTEFSYGIPQLLKLMNTPLTSASAEGAARLASKHNGDHAAVIEEMYLTALARRPTPAETRRMLAHVHKRGDAAEGYAGIFWALLNSAEFVSNR